MPLEEVIGVGDVVGEGEDSSGQIEGEGEDGRGIGENNRVGRG